jgi:tagaturonate reductase
MSLSAPHETKGSVILQFGTSRFLQAHIDYFVGKSLASGQSQASIVVVQTSKSAAGKARVSAMNELPTFPVRIQGIKGGQVIDEVEQVGSIESALVADSHWDKLIALFCGRVAYVVSNTADQGFVLNEADSVDSAPPRSYPAKLLVLLLARFRFNQVPVTMMPCELVANNGTVLKNLVVTLAKTWQLDNEFIEWLENDCLWINSLVDRIVSESIEPLGAVAEPYALWAIEHQAGLTLPCHHDAIRVVDNLAPLEWLKLSVLNLSHTLLVDLWQEQPESNIQTVCDAMNDLYLRGALESVLSEEVVPVLETMKLGENITDYVASVRERFLNPFLNHKLSDIAGNHHFKVERRILPLYQQALKTNPELPMTGLSDCLARNGLL